MKKDMTPHRWGEKTSNDVANEFKNEVYSLRRFLAGLTATTFGVLVALHPHEISALSCSKWFYVVSVIANGLSVICFISSLFGRYWKLMEEGTNLAGQEAADWTGGDYDDKKFKCAWRFRLYSIVGIACYVVAILSSCAYIVLEAIY